MTNRVSRRAFLKDGALITGALGLGTFAGSASAAAFARAQSEGADFVVVNARVWTGDVMRPMAQAFAVKDGLFVAVGSNDEIRGWIKSGSRKIDAKGLYIVPGMIDCHNHGNGKAVLYGPLVGNPYTIEFFTVERIVDILRKAASEIPPGYWVLGTFFDDTKLKDGEKLRMQDLDRVSTELPVRVQHRGGHTNWYNSKAFEMAGITENTPDPQFGAFVRDDEGNLTGQVAERANEVFADIAPYVPLPADADVKGLEYISEKFVEYGLTSVHMTSVDVDSLHEIRRKGKLRHRVYAERGRGEQLEAAIRDKKTTGMGDGWIRMGSVSEAAVDGSFSERTLRTVEPYHSQRPPNGIFTMSQEDTNEIVEKCMRNGIQVNLHVNGDAAIDRGLIAINRGQEMIPTPRNSYLSQFRPKATHCTILNKDLALVKRMKPVNLVPQLFTTYIYYNSEKWHLYGEDIMSRAMAFKTLLDNGIPVCQGTDFYPGPFSQLMALQGMVTRTGWNGETWGANQAVTVDQALRVLTLNGAYASYEEDAKGSISVGKYADYVTLSDDPHKAPDKILDNIEIVRTVTGGKVVYQK